MLRYRKKFDKDELMAQAVCSNHLAQESMRMDLKEHQATVSLRCSLLVLLLLLVPLPPGGCEGLPQDLSPSSTDAKRLSIPAAYLFSPAKAHTTEKILGSQIG